MNTQKVLIGGVVLAVILSLFTALTVKNGVNGRDGQDSQTLGAISTLDGVDYPYTTIGGVKTALLKQAIAATSTKLCRFKNPYATSTVLSATMNITSGILGANQISLSTTTGAQAGYATGTTYLIYQHTIATGARDQINWIPGTVATSTGGNGGVNNTSLSLNSTTTGEVTNTILNPGEWLSWGLASTTAGVVNVNYYQGLCTMTVREL